MVEGLLALALLSAVAYLIFRATRPKAKQPATVAQLRAELRRLTRDPEVAERLLARHRTRRPDASERELLRLAIKELRSDRR